MMENAYLVSCSVKGIKNIDTLVTLSFLQKNHRERFRCTEL